MLKFIANREGNLVSLLTNVLPKDESMKIESGWCWPSKLGKNIQKNVGESKWERLIFNFHNPIDLIFLINIDIGFVK